MRPATACPDAWTLEQFLLGQTPDEQAEQLEEHLADCPRCAALLGSVCAEDDLVAAMRTAAMPSQDDSPLVRAVTPLLKQLFSRQDAATAAFDPTSAPSTLAGTKEKTGITLDFLAPARDPGELGWLGPYRVLEVLGAGGMGVVLRAEDPRLKRIVALKVIKTGLAAGEEARQRFIHEAQSAAAVEHDNIVTIHEVDEANGIPYLVMPLLRGRSLEEHLRQTRPLPLAELLHVGRQIAEGLAAAHARGLVHRDIKPGNIFLVSRGAVSGESSKGNAPHDSPTHHSLLTTHHSPQVKILDFGLVQALGGNPVTSHTGMIVGTPAYMAPEQARRETVDGRADLFSLGCVLYHAATGKQPFRGSDVMSTLIQIAVDMPSPPRALNPKLPAALNDLILKLLAKKPEDRPASAAQVAQQLRALEQKLFGQPRLGWQVWLLAAALLLAAGSAIVVWLNRPSPEVVEPAPVEPGTITFNTDEPELRFTLQLADGEAREIDLKQNPTQRLPPGQYVLKASAGKRILWPGTLIVKAGEETKVSLGLVGEVRSYKGHAGTVTGVAMPGKGSLLVLSASMDRSLAVWDAARDDLVLSLQGPPELALSPVLCVAVSADGTLAVSGHGEKKKQPDLAARVWDLKTGKEIARFEEHGQMVTAVALAPDAKRVLSADAGGTVLMWNTATGKKLFALTEHDSWVNCAALSADGKYAASAGKDGKVHLSKADLGVPVKSFDTQGVAVMGVAFGPEATWLAMACADGTVRIWDWQTDKKRLWKAHPGGAACIAVAPDGKRLLSGGADGVVRLWDAASGLELFALTGHASTVRGVAFAADSRYAASGSADQTVRLWRLPD